MHPTAQASLCPAHNAVLRPLADQPLRPVQLMQGVLLAHVTSEIHGHQMWGKKHKVWAFIHSLTIGPQPNVWLSPHRNALTIEA